MTSRATRQSSPPPLSTSEIQLIAQDIADDRLPMVWFTAAAVGMAEGRSGKVVELGDPADEDYLRIRPTGSADVLSFSPAEVTLTKPVRERAAKAAASRPPSPASKGAQSVSQPSAPAAPATNRPQNEAPSSGHATPPKASGGKSPAAPAEAGTARATKSTANKPSRAARKGPEVAVTLTGNEQGEWTVDVLNGKKRTIRALPVSGSAVAQAAKILHPEVAEVVAEVLSAARGAQQAKVAQLQAELAAAERMLGELSDSPVPGGTGA